MKPFLAQFHIYADSESEVQDLQRSLYDFVSNLYQEGIYVSAPKLTRAVRSAMSNPLIKQYLK